MRKISAASMPALILSACMLLPAQEAAAHGVIDHGYNRHDRAIVYVHHRHRVMPRWLRRHSDFAYWYRLNYAYHPVDASWRRLLRRYERDYYYHRHFKGRKWAKYHKKRGKRHARRYRDYDD